MGAESFLSQTRGPSAQELCLPHQTGEFLRAGILRDLYIGVPFVSLPTPPTSVPCHGRHQITHCRVPVHATKVSSCPKPSWVFSKSCFQGPQPKGVCESYFPTSHGQ